MSGPSHGYVRTVALCAAFGLALSGGTPTRAQQPAIEPPKPAAEHPVKDGFRARLERRLNELRENQKALEEAIGKLDSGASADDVRRAFAERPGVMPHLLGDEEGREPRFGPGPDGPRPGREQDNRPRDPDRPFTADDQKTVREILAATYPEMVQKLDELFAKDPDAARRKVNEMGPRFRFLLDLHDRDPEMYKLRLEEVKTAREAVGVARDIAARVKAGAVLTSPELREPMERLRALVVAQLRNRLAVERRELADMQKRAEQKKQEIDSHGSDNDAMIDKQIRSLLDRAEKGKPGEEPFRQRPKGPKAEQRPPG